MSAPSLKTPQTLAEETPRSPLARYALQWEQGEMDRVLADVFGYRALQIGLGDLEALRGNRMPSRWVALDAAGLASTADVAAPASLHCDFHALPFPSGSLDLVVLPHTLESVVDPHQTLREVERVLMPEGRLVITGFNPASLWGVARRWRRLWPLWSGSRSRSQRPQDWPVDGGDWIAYWRLRDWLHLLGFEIEGGRFGCYAPPVRTQRWLERWAWCDRVGDRWWPVLGSSYCVVAVKRVRGMRMVGLARQRRRVPAPAPQVAAHRGPPTSLRSPGDRT